MLIDPERLSRYWFAADLPPSIDAYTKEDLEAYEGFCDFVAVTLAVPRSAIARQLTELGLVRNQTRQATPIPFLLEGSPKQQIWGHANRKTFLLALRAASEIFDSIECFNAFLFSLICGRQQVFDESVFWINIDPAALARDVVLNDHWKTLMADPLRFLTHR